MIRYDDIWIPLQNGLSRYLKIEVIQAEGLGKRPKYPFVTMKKITNAIIIGQPTSKIGVEEEMILEQDIEMVFSLTVNANSIEDADDYAMKARSYLEGFGYYELQDKNITVVEVLPSTNRDVFLTVDYERRVGFDIRLRVRGQDAYAMDVIEKVNLRRDN